MDLEIVAQKIADKYLNKNLDMNESIAKYASDHSLGVEQTKRLVEEANKNCYLQKFAATGEQTFDVAQFDKVKELVGLTDHVEKKASLQFTQVNYSDNFEKVASQEEANSFEYQQAIDRCHEAIGKELSKIASCRNEEEIATSNKIIEKYEKIAEKLLEKRAGVISSIAGVGLKGGAAVAGQVAKHPIALGLMPLGTVSTFNSGYKKTMKPAEKFIEHVDKTAALTLDALKASAGKFLENNAGAALTLGAIGLGLGAAKGMGGIASRMMQERQLNESFNTIVKANADLKQIPNARAYYDVVARHSPSLAMDPMVAPQLIRQFDTFGGVDVNTVGKLREIEAVGRKDQPRSGTSAFDILGGFNTVKSLNEPPKAAVPFKPNKPFFIKP